jgi:DNA-binding transcriptional MerR regulator
MSYTISQAAQMTGISPSAIRYYDKEGLLPQVERKNGIRLFSDMDIRWLHLLTCLKNTGMPIKRIREYAELAQRGDESLKERQALIRQQRQPSSASSVSLSWIRLNNCSTTWKSWILKNGTIKKHWNSVQKAKLISMNMNEKQVKNLLMIPIRE